MRKITAFGLTSSAVIALAGMSPSTKAQAPIAGGTACRVEAIKVPGVTIRSATTVPEGPAPMFGGSPNGAMSNAPIMPPHCLIEGAFEERIGAGGKPYAIAFQIRAPEAWNGRLIFQGGGGLNGFVGPAIGMAGSMASTAKLGLARGFAVVTTDSGHQGPNADFAEDQLAKLNFAYASIGKVAIVAKQIVALTGGRRPDRTYFVGCSNGGREAMIAAQRFPEEFDGVIASNPAFNLGQAGLLAHYSTSIYSAGAPKGPDGAPITPLALSPVEASLLSQGILKQCDGLDGMKDGFVFNHTACKFDPGVLQCGKGSKAGQCLPAGKVAMVRRAMAGPLNGQGKPLFTSWPYDGGVGTPGWLMWQTGIMGPDGKPQMGAPMLVNEAVSRYFHYPMLSGAEIGRASTPQMLRAIAPTAAMTDAVSTHMSTFAAKGGKMLLVTGWSDPIFSAADLASWYTELDQDMTRASKVRADSFARLFMVPGMTHCGGGPALDNFDALSTLLDWVEQGKAPESMMATGASHPGVSRPICAYPKITTYRSGPKDLASSYVCGLPKAG